MKWIVKAGVWSYDIFIQTHPTNCENVRHGHEIACVKILVLPQ